MTVDVTRYDGGRAQGECEALVSLYRAVFTGPPWHEDDTAVGQFRSRIGEDFARTGFRVVVASLGGREIGFATGWLSPLSFPTDRGYGAVRDALGERAVQEMLVGALEVDDLAVVAAARGAGAGAALLAALTADAPDGRTWLLTWQHAPDAVRFYRRVGWHQITPDDAPDGVVVFLGPQHPAVAPRSR